MEPRIQYAKTKDGVSIAYSTLGEGMPPLVVLPSMPISHIEREWHLASYRHWYEGLAEKKMLVRYDSRGSGLSDDTNNDYSLDSYVTDLEAVVDRLELERVALFGAFQAGAPAIAYAARHPERVSHLLLWCCYAKGTDPLQTAQIRATRRTAEEDWATWLEAAAHLVFGWSDGDEGRHAAQVWGEITTAERVLAFWEAYEEMDVTPLLRRVKAPTLVVHRRELRVIDVGVAKKIASTIPNARLALLEGGSGAPYLGDSEAVYSAIDEFLSEDEESTAGAKTLVSEDVHTLLFTDVEGSTALTQRLGDAKARDLLREHERMVREALKAHVGSEVKTMGDGFMASFTSASRALEAAVAIQRSFVDQNEEYTDTAIRVRIGLNAGEPVVEDDDLFGTAVQLAARVCAQAEPGQILASNVVQELAAGKGFDFDDQGEATLKGFEKPVRLHEVRWQEDA